MRLPTNLRESARTGCGKRNFYPQPEAYWKKDAKHPTNWTCHFFKGAYAQGGARFACFSSMPSAVRIRGDSPPACLRQQAGWVGRLFRSFFGDARLRGVMETTAQRPSNQSTEPFSPSKPKRVRVFDGQKPLRMELGGILSPVD